MNRSARLITTVDLRGLGSIPIDNAEAALRFVRHWRAGWAADVEVGVSQANEDLAGTRSGASTQSIGRPELSVVLPVTMRRRIFQTEYTFFSLMLLALDGLISFSFVPLRIITFLRFAVSFLSIYSRNFMSRLSFS